MKAQVEENTARLRRLTGLMQLGVEALKETDAIALLEACVYLYLYFCLDNVLVHVVQYCSSLIRALLREHSSARLSGPLETIHYPSY